MYAYLKGKIVHREAMQAILEVGGIGYDLRISLQTSEQLEEDKAYKLFTHLQIRDDAHTLFAFYTQTERKLFLMLNGVSGVGAATALMILSSLDSNELRDAISSGEHKRLQAVKGIGAKTAQRIVIELKDKINDVIPAGESSTEATSAAKGFHQGALEALMALGMSKIAADRSIRAALKNSEAEITSEEMLIKAALRNR
ncbi:MAG: Holliday junction branch migration protein RuvA [Bernardetiaceae bacterium]|nr:Holliday junction branch migration protein RuvA [Bernardetiaceae bacterium]